MVAVYPRDKKPPVEQVEFSRLVRSRLWSLDQCWSIEENRVIALRPLRNHVVRYYPLSQQNHMILDRILICEVDPHPVLLVELDHCLVNDYPSRPPERLVQHLHHLIKPGRNLLRWNTSIAQTLIDDVTNTRTHRLKNEVETIVHCIVERGNERSSHKNHPSMRIRTTTTRIHML